MSHRKYRWSERTLFLIVGPSVFLVLLAGLGCSRAQPVEVNTTLAGREKEWTFVGRPIWKEKGGVIYSPLYSNPMFDFYPGMPNSYADYAVFVDHPEFSWSGEYAYPTTRFFSDIDTSITFEQRYTSGRGCGIALRAQDSLRLYTVEVADMGRKGHDWRVALVLHDDSGYRTELASGYAPHSVMAEDFLHGRIKDRDMWEKSSPVPATLRVRAKGPKITAYIDGKEIFGAEDSTYLTGASGIFSNLAAANTFRNYTLTGTPVEGGTPGWKQANLRGLESYPYASGAVGRYTGHPRLSRGSSGEILLSFEEGKGQPPAHFGSDGTSGVAFMVSADEGKTWSRSRMAVPPKDYSVGVGGTFARQDDSWVLLAVEIKSAKEEGAPPKLRHIQTESKDKGVTWSPAREILFGGKPSSAYGWREFNWPHAITRLKDGTLIGTGYRMEVAPGSKTVDNTTAQTQAFVVRSTDDGATWSAPIFIDKSKFDTNECMIGEPEPGKLISFSRTLRGRHMWTATSDDGGQSWSELRESAVAGECPVMLTHSGGALILATRNTGVTISFDGGHIWTKPRILTVDGMMAMTELSDGRVLIAGHLGWANPTYITADTFRITQDGPVADR